MELFNNLSAEQRRELIKKAGDKRLTLSFYKYHKILNPQLFRDHLFVLWNELDVLGRIYIANEGINAQLSVPSKNLDNFKKTIDEVRFLKDTRLNIAIEQDDFSFLKLKIKVRNKIVADGLKDGEIDLSKCGEHLNAKEFNSLVSKSDTVLVDMRNHYESEIGHFKDAVLPDVDSFRESLPIVEKSLKKHKKTKNIVMYCTGGIRCEKASTYLKHKGFENVFQLSGGIIEYSRQVKNSGLENKFIGKNFVFDHRRSESISGDVISRCHQCGAKCDTHVNCSNEACHLLFLQCKKCSTKFNECCSVNCMEINAMPIEEQKKLRKGQKNSNKIFKKGRSEVLTYKNATC